MPKTYHKKTYRKKKVYAKKKYTMYKHVPNSNKSLTVDVMCANNLTNVAGGTGFTVLYNYPSWWNSPTSTSTTLPQMGAIPNRLGT